MTSMVFLVKIMWLYYLLLAVVATQAGKRQQVTKGLFPGGQNQNDVMGDSQISISGTGTIGKNGKTSLNIQVQIAPGAGQEGGAGPGGPGAGAGGPGAAAGAGGPGVGPAGPGAGAGGPGAGPGGPEAGAGGPGAGGGEFTQEEKMGLKKHNEFREVHQVPPMTLDRQMCDQAKAYAQTLLDMGSLQHSSKQEREGQGENLSMGCSSNKAQAMEEAVTNWYNEVCKPGYNFNGGGFSGGTGHFTQVVWKGSTVLGIGRAEGPKGNMKCAYIVGRYKPAGNMMGDFPENVPKGNFDANSYCASIKNGKKFFDDQRQAMVIDSSFSAVDVPTATSGPAEFRRQQNVLLTNKKKKTNILKKHN